MGNQQRKFIFDKVISKYQSLSEQEKLTIDVIIKVLIVLFSIVLIYKVGGAVGEYLFNINLEI
jgi:uncharacterized membrane protein